MLLYEMVLFNAQLQTVLPPFKSKCIKQLEVIKTLFHAWISSGGPAWFTMSKESVCLCVCVCVYHLGFLFVEGVCTQHLSHSFKCSRQRQHELFELVLVLACTHTVM